MVFCHIHLGVITASLELNTVLQKELSLVSFNCLNMAETTFKPHFFVCLGCLLDSATDEGVSAQVTMSCEFLYVIVWLAWVPSFKQNVESLDYTASKTCRHFDTL